jgi:hypothetical protein
MINGKWLIWEGEVGEKGEGGGKIISQFSILH